MGKLKLKAESMKKLQSGTLLVLLLLAFGCSQPKVTKSPAAGKKPDVDQSKPPESSKEKLKICSFNIQFLGNSKIRADRTLAKILRDNSCAIVVVQELVAPPDLRILKGSSHYQKGELPVFPRTGESLVHSERATVFFKEMEEVGFADFLLSEEDTGTSQSVKQNNGSATEWWVTFYDSSKVAIAKDLPSGFLAENRNANTEFDRVPYAFPFRAIDGSFDFVLISVHLHPDSGHRNALRRKQELDAIGKWVHAAQTKGAERDFIILGDMNLEDNEEVQNSMPEGFVTLNTKAQWNTNTNLNNPKPYDHVMINPTFTSEVRALNNFQVLNLIELVRPHWILPVFPGDPYNHNIFRLYFSDHHPIAFEADLPVRDDD